MEDINVFNYSKIKLMNERPSKIVSWNTILFIILILFIIISIFLKYHIYSDYVGYIDNNNIRIIIDNKSFPVKNNYKLYIDNKKYQYEIINIEKKNEYYELLIKCNLNKSLLINNNVIKVTFQKETTTFMKEIIKKLKRGMV